MSISKSLTIAAGDAGDEASYVVDLERNYALIRVSCADTDGIATSTTMSAKMDVLPSGHADAAERDVWFEDGSAIWVSGTLPATDDGTFSFWLRGAAGARRIRLILSNNVEAAKPTTFTIWGFGALD